VTEYSNSNSMSPSGVEATKPKSERASLAVIGNGFSSERAHPTTAQRPRVSVIVVTYGSQNELPDCMEGLLKQRVPLEVFLVDNASPDNTAEMVVDYATKFRNVHAILSPKNVGLAAGNNIPKDKCQGDYVLMLNPDTVFRDNSLERMIDFLDQNHDVSVVGPRNVYPDGSAHVSYGRAWGIREVLMWRVLPYRIPRLLHDRMSHYKEEDVLFVSGSCLLIRREIFDEIGGYDPEYFLCVEDVCDLCIRARKTGSRVVFLANEEVMHLTGRSALQAPYLVVWQGIRGTVYHFLKHKGVLQALLVSFMLGAASGFRLVIAGILSIAKKKYRNVARIYACVLRDLIVENPIRVNRLAANSTSERKECARRS